MLHRALVNIVKSFAIPSSKWLVGTGLLVCSGIVLADAVANEVHRWLERMNRAVVSLNYEGRFVYEHGDHLEALFIKHSVEGGVERERLISLNGSRRQIVRDNESVTCILPQQQKIDIGRRLTARRLAPISPIRPAQLADHYDFEMAGMTRVAGRSARDIVIRPKDELRFGYQLSLDEKFALPLRTAMLDKEGAKVSQILFTHLRVGEFADPIANDEPLPPQMTTNDQGTRQSEVRAHLMQAPAWVFSDIPSGFMLDVHRRPAHPASDTYREHFIFSDGLATVSVYVEHSGPRSINGAADAGPMNAFGRDLGGHQVTAIGEVPLVTVRLFSEAIRAVAHRK